MNIIIIGTLILLNSLSTSRQFVKHILVPQIQPLLQEHSSLIILFMKQHPFCQKINTSYRNIAQTLSVKYSLGFFIVMYQQNAGLFKKFDIEAAPEIVFYKNGIRLKCDLTGLYQHSEQELREWIQEKFRSNLKRILKLEKGNTSKLIDIGCSKQKELLNLSIKDNHNQYYCSESLIGNHSMGEVIFITLKQTFVYDQRTNLEQWIRTYQDGYLKPLTDYYIHKIFNSNQSHFVLLTHYDSISTQVLSIYEQYARNNTNSTLSFIHSHIDNLQMQVEMVNFVGFTSEFPYPHLSFLNIQDGQLTKYYPGKISQYNLTQWMNRAKNRQLIPFIKNQDYELKEQPSSFSSIGHNQLMNITSLSESPIPVFIYFYSEYCQECVLRLGDVKHDIAISKSDAKYYYKYSITDNDVPFFATVESVPTLIYLSEDQKVTYLEQQHNVNNMVKFVKNNNQDIVKRRNPNKTQTKSPETSAKQGGKLIVTEENQQL